MADYKRSPFLPEDLPDRDDPLVLELPLEPELRVVADRPPDDFPDDRALCVLLGAGADFVDFPTFAGADLGCLAVDFPLDALGADRGRLTLVPLLLPDVAVPTECAGRLLRADRLAFAVVRGVLVATRPDFTVFVRWAPLMLL